MIWTSMEEIGWYKLTGRSLTVFPFVVIMVASLPLISVTSPSIHASSGSSIHTWDPTMMFTGVPWIIIQDEEHKLNYFNIVLANQRMENELNKKPWSGRVYHIEKIIIWSSNKLQNENEYRKQVKMWWFWEREDRRRNVWASQNGEWKCRFNLKKDGHIS